MAKYSEDCSPEIAACGHDDIPHLNYDIPFLCFSERSLLLTLYQVHIRRLFPLLPASVFVLKTPPRWLRDLGALSRSEGACVRSSRIVITDDYHERLSVADGQTSVHEEIGPPIVVVLKATGKQHGVVKHSQTEGALLLQPEACMDRDSTFWLIWFLNDRAP